MTIELIGIIALLIGTAGIFCEPAFVVRVFFCSTLLGSAAAFTLPALGATSIQPAHLFLGFFAFKLMGSGNPKGLKAGLAIGRPGFWLMLALIWSVLSAYFLPRIFAGQTFVFPTRTTGYTLPLEPGTSNLTQSVYLIGDFVFLILLYGYAATRVGRRVMEDAALLCVALNLVFAALDLVTFYTNTAEILSFIRNANYGLLNDTELGGSKRIVGSFVEASSFGAMTLGYFAFSGKLWLEGVHPRLTLILAGLSFGSLLLSTSSTAIIGLGAFLIVAYLHTIFNAVRRPPNPQTWWFIAGTPIAAPLVMVAIALNESSSIHVGGLLNELVFNKLSSESGIERSSWNAQGLQNFIDTFGFGVGNGSMRASSFPVSVLASVGIVGALTMGLFLVTVFLSGLKGGANPVRNAYRNAAKYACLAWLIAATVSGALIDLGLPFFAFAALACSPVVSSFAASNRRRLTRSARVLSVESVAR
jgi:hypothetical protein